VSQAAPVAPPTAPTQVPPAPTPAPAPPPPTPTPAPIPAPTTKPTAPGLETVDPDLRLPPRAPGKPKRIHVIEDRFHEFSGTVRAEEDDYVVIDSGGRLKSFFRSRVLDVIELVDPAPGQPGVVKMRDGRTYPGTIIADNFDGVDIEIQGILQKLPRKEVHHVTLTQTPRQFYEKARKEIPTEHYTDRVRLAQYLYNKKMYSEAREELLAVLESVELHDAKELLRMVDAQLALGTPIPATLNPKKNPVPDSVRTPDDELGDNGEPIYGGGSDTGPVEFRDTLPTRILTSEDVNLIRVYEFDFQRPPRVAVSPDLIRAMIAQFADSKLIPESSDARNELFRADPLKIVRLLFDLKARDLYDQIQIGSEPYALNLFRQRVHNAWLIGNCATSKCHGGVDAGRFFLHNRNYKNTEVRYTNLLLLERTRIEGKPPLIDWDKPLDSLIIQYALPRTEARLPHPEVDGWKPVFLPVNKKLLEEFEGWVRAMYKPRPDYPIKFSPPQLKAPDHAPPEGPRVPR